MQAILVALFGAASVFLRGCTFSSATSNCDGETCSCSWTFHSFWARIRISDVPIEHAGRDFHIINVARDVPNATFSPCCSAIFDQIDYDEGKSAGSPNKTVDSFSRSCQKSPNQEVASAASGSSPTTKDVSGARTLNSLRPAAAAPQRSVATAGKNLQSEPWINHGESGQDCEVTTGGGFPLNNVLISAPSSMKVRVKWVDPLNGNTPCCNALTPILQHVYLKNLPESGLSADIKSNFCGQCTQSPNQGIALAAYRCFGKTRLNATADVAV